MKIRQGKIKAFSLQEMMVVLLITTIVVGMAFAVLNLVQKQMGGISTIYEVKTTVNQLRQSLWIDFNRYSHIRYDNKTSQIHCSNELGERYYNLENEKHIVNENNLDIEFESIQFYFKNKEVFNGQIDAVAIRTSKETGYQQLFVFKENTPVIYINQEK